LLDNQIEHEEMMWGISTSMDVRSDTGSWGRSVYTLKVDLERNKLLFDRQLKPLLPIDFSITFYDEPFKSPVDEERKRELSEKYDASGLYFLHMVFYLVFNIFGI